MIRIILVGSESLPCSKLD